MFFTKRCPLGGTEYVSFELFLGILRSPGTVPLQNPEVTSRKACLRNTEKGGDPQEMSKKSSRKDADKSVLGFSHALRLQGILLMFQRPMSLIGLHPQFLEQMFWVKKPPCPQLLDKDIQTSKIPISLQPASHQRFRCRNPSRLSAFRQITPPPPIKTVHMA